MRAKIGSRIASLRRAKGMTQEQLAAALGVSSPAVSKWETDSSCPDITLLCPLARALGTNVDTLLQFEEELSNEQIVERINAVMETGRAQGAQTAERMLKELLQEYPSSSALQFNAAAVLTMFEVMFPSEPKEKREQWKLERKALLRKICQNTTSVYRQSALLQLSSIAITDDELEEAEQLLNELPEQTIDPTLQRTSLYLKRDETEKAKELMQKRLYTLVGQVQSCLIMLAGEKMEPDVEKALEICDIYRQTEELFGCGGGMSPGVFAEVYHRAGQEEKMMESLIRLIDVITSPMPIPKPLLFSKAIKQEHWKGNTTREMREMILRGIETEQKYFSLLENEEFQAAVEKLRASIA